MTSGSSNSGFNPNNARYKTCCCHAKTFTIVVGILEIFSICFILVAVLPDVNMRICGTQRENTSNLEQNATEEYVINKSYLRSFVCEMNLVWLIWALAQIVSVNLMFLGIKNIRWLLFIPHLIFRLAGAGIIGCLVTLLIYSLFWEEASSTYIVGLVFALILILFWIYATYAEICCVHFVKRSQETGFSISVARPIGPATISLSEREQIPTTTILRQLPPLRHTYGGRDPQKYTE